MEFQFLIHENVLRDKMKSILHNNYFCLYYHVMHDYYFAVKLLSRLFDFQFSKHQNIHPYLQITHIQIL